MTFITNFADEAVILPLAVAIGIALWALDWRRGAMAWAVAVAGTLAVMLVLKLFGLACGPPLLRTPSGHTAAAAVICGGLAVVLVQRNRRRVIVLVALFAAMAIGLLRLALGAHSLPEVMVGGAVGVAGALVLARLAGPPPDRLRRRWIAAVVAAVLVLFHGQLLPAEAHINGLAFSLARQLQVCSGPASRQQAVPGQQRP